MIIKIYNVRNHGGCPHWVLSSTSYAALNLLISFTNFKLQMTIQDRKSLFQNLELQNKILANSNFVSAAETDTQCTLHIHVKRVTYYVTGREWRSRESVPRERDVLRDISVLRDRFSTTSRPAGDIVAFCLMCGAQKPKTPVTYWPNQVKTELAAIFERR